MVDEDILHRAAIVCDEIHTGHKAILYAERSEPVEAADSGWQFLCGAAIEDEHSAKVWSIQEILIYDPSLIPFIEFPPGSCLSRASATKEWQIEKKAT